MIAARRLARASSNTQIQTIPSQKRLNAAENWREMAHAVIACNRTHFNWEAPNDTMGCQGGVDRWFLARNWQSRRGRCKAPNVRTNMSAQASLLRPSQQFPFGTQRLAPLEQAFLLAPIIIQAAQ